MCQRPRYGKTFKRIFGWTVLTGIVVRLVVLGPDVDFLLYIMANGVIGGIVLVAMLGGIMLVAMRDGIVFGAMLSGIVTLSMWIAYRFFR